MNRWHGWQRVLMAGVAAAGLVLAACPSAPKPVPPVAKAVAGPMEVRWRALSARGQVQYVRMDLPVVVSGGKITIGGARRADAESQNAKLKTQNAGVETGVVGAASAPLDASGATTTAAPSVAATSAATMETASQEVGMPVAWRGSVEVYSTHIVRGPVEGPMVEQLTGQVRQVADAGSFLVPLKRTSGDGGESFEVGEPTPLYFKVNVPAVVDAGTYVLPVELTMPGRETVRFGLEVEVSDITLPTDPRVLAVATTTVGELAKIYPETWGTIAGQYVDRADVDAREAVGQLDALVKAARAEGVALFVEDMIPATKVDELGQVTLDWDAYDRVMQPYMDGSAFVDRVPMPVWLAPVPPRRLRDASTQLWQYIDLCAKHFAEKKWVAVPAFLHPAVAGGEERAKLETQNAKPGDAAVLRDQVSEMMRLHMPREMLAVAVPGAAVPHGQLWAVNDDDPRLPPAGGLANEQSVRAWPWVCVARGNTTGAGGIGGLGGSPTGVKGLVWRDALAAADELVPGARAANEIARRPLLVVDRKAGAVGSGKAMASLRMVWLGEGLNDAALLGLLERRADVSREGMVAEILAGMAGRTGMVEENAKPETQNAKPDMGAVTAPAGFLYAGWPVEGRGGVAGVWEQVTPNLHKLVLASDPGSRGAMDTNDPVYLAAKLWLVGTRRPVARVTGYDFLLRGAVHGGDILDARMRLAVENPVSVPAEMELKFSNLPGDFDLDPKGLLITGGAGTTRPAESGTGEGAGGRGLMAMRRQGFGVGASGLTEVTLPLAGHVGEVMENPEVETMEIGEKFNGAVLRLPVRMPVYRIHAVDAPGSAGVPKIDGKDDDWAMDNMLRVYGEMQVGTRYLSRADLLSGSLRVDEKAAHVRWMYDSTYLYMIAVCPQDAAVTEDRVTEWPVVAGAGGGVRWWGSDGLQVELAAMPRAGVAGAAGGGAAGEHRQDADATNRVVKIGFKPSGVVLVETGTMTREAKGAGGTAAIRVAWKDGAPAVAGPAGGAGGGAAGGIKYGISVQKREGRVTGYTVEAAIPRAWVEENAKLETQNAKPEGSDVPVATAPAWRVNVLRHRAEGLVSSSWSGPVVEDEDVGMMGAMVGE